MNECRYPERTTTPVINCLRRSWRGSLAQTLIAVLITVTGSLPVVAQESGPSVDETVHWLQAQLVGKTYFESEGRIGKSNEWTISSVAFDECVLALKIRHTEEDVNTNATVRSAITIEVPLGGVQVNVGPLSEAIKSVEFFHNEKRTRLTTVVEPCVGRRGACKDLRRHIDADQGKFTHGNLRHLPTGTTYIGHFKLGPLFWGSGSDWDYDTATRIRNAIRHISAMCPAPAARPREPF
jgi:hypothetical protein